MPDTLKDMSRERKTVSLKGFLLLFALLALYPSRGYVLLFEQAGCFETRYPLKPYFTYSGVPIKQACSHQIFWLIFQPARP